MMNSSVSGLFQEKIKEMFENLMQVEHPNIVKFHKYWLDMKESQARVCRLFKHSQQVLFLNHSNSCCRFPHRLSSSQSTCPLAA